MTACTITGCCIKWMLKVLKHSKAGYDLIWVREDHCPKMQTFRNSGFSALEIDR